MDVLVAMVVPVFLGGSNCLCCLGLEHAAICLAGSHGQNVSSDVAPVLLDVEGPKAGGWRCNSGITCEKKCEGFVYTTSNPQKDQKQ